MAFTEEDLVQLGKFIETKITDGLAVAHDAAVVASEVSREFLVGKPEVSPTAGPEYYVHLADGSVVVTHDSGSTHMANAAGDQMLVVGRYAKGA